MAIMRIKQLLGITGTAVDLRLDNPRISPGETMSGVIVVEGGDFEVDVRTLVLSLEAKAEVETDDGEHLTTVRFAKLEVGGPFELAPGAKSRFPVQFPIPIETPFNVINGTTLKGCGIGIRTEMDIRRAIDKADMDPIEVHPLPSQTAVLQAFDELGFQFKRSDFEKGRISGNPLPFYQEVEFGPSSALRGKVNEVEVTFLTRTGDMDVLVELDKRGGLLSSGSDRVGRFTISHADATGGAARGAVERLIEDLGRKRGLFG